MHAKYKVPVFAVEGHPNEGKSTVVSTLTEDDSVRVSPVPGETVECRSFPVLIDGEEVIRFVDTPGFQNPQATLDWFRRHVGTTKDLAREFWRAHVRLENFLQDCKLLEPLADGAGIIYVVDGARPVRAADKAEMEILRLTGNPRMAIINSKEEEPEYLEDWKEALRRHFNSVRLFNAHRATYQDRLALLEALKSIEQDWEPALQRTIEAFRHDWNRRVKQTAAAICDHLEEALLRTESKNITDQADEEAAKNALTQRFQQSIGRIERGLQERIKKIHKHNRFERNLDEHSILGHDLFSSRTWQVLGLTRKQLVLAGSATGAVIGGVIDAHAGLTTFLLGSAIGAVAGGASVFFKGAALAALKVKNIRLGGKQISVGPIRNPNFPFVFIDRALLFYREAINWAHGRRDYGAARPLAGTEKQGWTAKWSQAQKKLCFLFVKAVSSGSPEKKNKARQELAAMLEKTLDEIGGG